MSQVITDKKNMFQEALRLHQAGDLASAIILYNKILDEQPDNAMVHYNLASALQGLGKTADALASFRKATEPKPDDADTHYNLGNTLMEQGKIDKAIVSYKQAVSLKPDNAELHYNLGAALHESGKLTDAAASYNRAIKLKPDSVLAYNNLGTVLKDLSKLDKAVECYRKAIGLKPDYAEAHNNLGTALLEQRKLEEAVICHNRAIAIKPEYAEAYNNLGMVLQELCKMNESITNYKKSIALKSTSAETHNNLGTALQCSGKLGEALASYEQAISLKPDFTLAHVNKSFVLLLTQNFKEGWQEHKWRLNIKGRSTTTSEQQMWDGKPLNDKTILVHTEQGFGDTIQFVRYLPMVKAQNGRVIFECQQSLHRLLKNCNGIDEIIENNSPDTLSEQPDVHTHLLDLPGIFKTTLKSIPSHIPYITPDPILVDQWAARLNVNDDFKIGIVWAGDTHHTKDRNLSCSLTDFAKLAEVHGLSFYSLQKGHASIECDNPPIGMKIVNLDNEINDFADTAAVIANLDLVLSVDTAVAHLAGAIGKPVWTLLPFAPDWRWLLKRADSPWYPSMHLFRQSQPDDWSGVFEQLKQKLLKNLED